MSYLVRAVNTDPLCVASEYGQISKRGDMGACWLTVSSDTHLMTPFGKKHILPEKLVILFTYAKDILFAIIRRIMHFKMKAYRNGVTVNHPPIDLISLFS